MEQRPERAAPVQQTPAGSGLGPWRTAEPTGNAVPDARGPVIVGTVAHPDGSPGVHAPLTLATLRGDQVDRAVSDEAGGYRLSPPTDGSYIVICVAGECQPQAALVTIAGRSVRHDVTLAGPGGGVHGTVRVGTTGRGAAAVVVMATDAGGAVVAATTTDEWGTYGFDNLGRGAYTLTAASTEYQPVAVPVSVSGGRVQRDIELTGRCRLTGTVRASSDGKPVRDALVTVIDSTGTVVGATTTTGSGTYAFDNLPEGPYTLTAAGYAPVASTVRLSAGTANSADVTLTSPRPHSTPEKRQL